ncbi:MAG: manganese efflux pump MntP family protein [Dehalococcoidia bacterium]|nr:manganese efflux pump MntP family protein [Dehalococcoidia bacterium]
MNGTDYLVVFLIAIGLSADCFAVALSASVTAKNPSRLQVLRVAAMFGLFQAIMPVLGWLAGQTMVKFIASYDHFLAFVLLAIVGGRMIWESFHHKKEYDEQTDVTKGWMLLTLSVATSIDALAVGFSIAFMDVHVAVASIIIGVVAFIATVIGFLLGKKAGALIGRWAEAIGGIVLIGIGLRILISHLLGYA